MERPVANCSITLKVRFRWWLWLYIWGVQTTVALTGLEPDWAKVGRMVQRGVYTEIV